MYMYLRHLAAVLGRATHDHERIAKVWLRCDPLAERFQHALLARSFLQLHARLHAETETHVPANVVRDRLWRTTRTLVRAMPEKRRRKPAAQRACICTSSPPSSSILPRILASVRSTSPVAAFAMPEARGRLLQVGRDSC